MSHLNKKLAVTAAAAAMLASLGLAVAQSNDGADPTVTPVEQQQVDVNANASGNQIYFFRDQGNSPETDPAAHLMLIKHQHMVPVAERTTTTTVAQSTTPAADSSTTTVMPGPADTSNTESSASTSQQVASADETPMLAPKADRN